MFTSCQNWLTEFRLYRRDDKGQVVKTMDHLMDATRYLIVMLASIERVMPDYLVKAGLAPRVQQDYDPWG